MSDTACYLMFSFDGTDLPGLNLSCSQDGLDWETLGVGTYNPGLGDKGLFRDPSVHVDTEGVFHMVWTTGSKGFGYARSTDAVHWEAEQYVEVADPARGLDFVNVWAPFLFVDQDGALILWSSTLRKDYTPQPEGSDRWWEATWNHRFYYTRTKDWNTFTPTAQFWDPCYNAIDAKIHRVADGYRLIFKDERKQSKHLVRARATDLYGPYLEQETISSRFTEGAIILERAVGDYLVYVDRYLDGGYVALPASNLDDLGEPVQLVKDRVEPPLRHGSIAIISPKHLAVVKAALGVG